MGKLGSLAHLKEQHPETQIVLWGCMVGPNNQSIFKVVWEWSIILSRPQPSMR